MGGIFLLHILMMHIQYGRKVIMSREIKFRALNYGYQWMYYSLTDLVAGDAITHIDLELKPESMVSIHRTKR